MTTLEKKNYNKLYYLKNREKVLEKAKTRVQDKSVTQDSKGTLPRPKESDLKKNLDLKVLFSVPMFFLQTLVVAMTYFLVTEIAAFYLSIDPNKFDAYLKALILEGAVLAFTLLKGSTPLQNISYKLMILFIYAYSTWVISGTVIHSALHAEAALKLSQKTVVEIETEISKKEIWREQSLKLERIKLARKYDQSIEALKSDLNKARQSLLQVPSSVTIWNSLLVLILFRILVMVSNLFCFQALCRRFNFSLNSNS